MYACYFLKVKPLLQPLATRTLAGDAQREEGFGWGITPNGKIWYGNGRKRKREKQEIDIVGMGSLSSAFFHFVMGWRAQLRKLKGIKVVYEAAEAKARSAQSLFASIKQAKDMFLSAATREERLMYQYIENKLIGNQPKNMT